MNFNEKYYTEKGIEHLLNLIDQLRKDFNILEAKVEDIDVHVMEHDLDGMVSSIMSLEQDRIHVKKTEERLAILEGKIRKLETENLHAKLSNPSSVSLAHIEHPLPPDLVDSLIQLWQAYEKHRPREKCSHEKGDPRKPCISRYTFSDSFPNILFPDLLSSRQTSTLRESFERFLFQLRVRALALHGSSSLASELFQAGSSLMSTPELECRVEQYEDRILLRFLDGNHPERVHSEITLHLNSHSS